MDDDTTPRGRALDELTVGRAVHLVALSDQYLPLLWQWDTAPSNLVSGRLRGHVPPPGAYRTLVWEGSLCQFVVAANGGEQPLGVVNAYRADLRSGHCSVSLYHAPEALTPGRPSPALEGAELFITYLFEVFGLRKVYVEVAEFNRRPMASFLEAHCVHEGTMRDHELAAGRHWDVELHAIERSSWQARRDRLVAASHLLRVAPMGEAGDGFADALGDLLGLDLLAAEDEDLLADLGMDSLRAYACWVLLDDLAAGTIALDALTSSSTLGDLRHWFTIARERREGRAPGR